MEGVKGEMSSAMVQIGQRTDGDPGRPGMDRCRGHATGGQYQYIVAFITE